MSELENEIPLSDLENKTIFAWNKEQTSNGEDKENSEDVEHER